MLAVLVVLAIRIRFLELPLERDEGEYAYGAQVLLRGGVPFRDFYTLKLPGTHAAYAPAVALFGDSAIAVRLGYLAASLATSFLLFLLGRRLGDAVVGTTAAVLFLVATSNLCFLGLFAHATQFLVLPMVAAVLCLVIAGTQKRGSSWLALSGFLFGLAVVVKQHAAVFVLFAAVVAALAERRRGGGWAPAARDGLLVLGGAAMPMLLLAVWFLATGAFDEFWLWCVRYAPQYASMTPLGQGLRLGAYRLLGVTLSLPLFTAFALWGGVAAKRTGRRGWLLLWLAASALAVLPGLYFREHYFVPLLPVAAILAGFGMADLVRRGPIAAGLVAGAVLASALYPLWRDRAFLLEPDLKVATHRLYGPEPFPQAVEVGRYLRQRAAPGDRLAVLGSDPEILFFSGLPSATGYLYTYPLMEPHSLALWMQRDLMQRLEAARPRWITLVSVKSSWWEPKEGVPTPIIDWMERFLPAHYDVVGVADIISPHRTEYRWDEAAASYQQVSNAALWVYRLRESP